MHVHVKFFVIKFYPLFGSVYDNSKFFVFYVPLSNVNIVNKYIFI